MPDFDDDEQDADDLTMDEDPDPSDQDSTDEDGDTCPHCGKYIFEDAAVCPHCLQPTQVSSNLWHEKAWVVLGLIGFVIILILAFWSHGRGWTAIW